MPGRLKSAAWILSGALAMGVMGGCASNKTAPADVNFYVEESANEIRAGEIVTLVAKTENTYGRDPKVTWASNGGNLKTEDNGRVARVQFDRPGVYKVDATLEVEGKFVRRDTTMIEVRPLP